MDLTLQEQGQNRLQQIDEIRSIRPFRGSESADQRDKSEGDYQKAFPARPRPARWIH